MMLGMNTAVGVVALASGIALTLTAIAALVRVVRGPTILDRIIASDVLVTTLMLVAGADMVIRQHTHSIPLMTVLAATATLATIAVARFVKRSSTQSNIKEGGKTHV
jgi:multicomponent Na+:H+ antiporter subunit F